MKRTILLAMLTLSLSLGANSVYAQTGVKSPANYAASNPQSSSWRNISPWQQMLLVLSAIYIP
jgi:hypothetical protein